MDGKLLELIERLEREHSLSVDEYEYLIVNKTDEAQALLAEKASAVSRRIYGNEIFLRGIVEFSNICKNDCYYCGIRRSNANLERYRLSPDEIFRCCEEGYELGLRTFVLQSGEDPYYTDDILADLVSKIHGRFPDCAITLSLGERSRESYQRRGRLYGWESVSDNAHAG